MMKRQRSRKASNQRKGAAAVELAVTFPILMLVLFALFELTRANMMIHTAEAAAYDCASSPEPMPTMAAQPHVKFCKHQALEHRQFKSLQRI
jgi:hypothetical protein